MANSSPRLKSGASFATIGEKENFTEYCESAYFSLKRNAYYVKAEGGSLSKMGGRYTGNKHGRVGISRFTEKEFADYMEKKIHEKEIEDLKELNGSEAFQLLLKKYRLRWLFKEN